MHGCGNTFFSKGLHLGQSSPFCSATRLSSRQYSAHAGDCALSRANQRCKTEMAALQHIPFQALPQTSLATPRGGRRTETEEVDVAIIVALHTRGGLHSRRLLLSKRPPTRHLALLSCLVHSHKLARGKKKEKKKGKKREKEKKFCSLNKIDKTCYVAGHLRN